MKRPLLRVEIPKEDTTMTNPRSPAANGTETPQVTATTNGPGHPGCP